MHRREFLVRAGSGAAGAVVLSGSASAQSSGFAHWDAQPEHVALGYDQQLAERYRPALVTRHLDIDPISWFCWIARSPERETDAYVYWMDYPLQEGVSPLAGPLSDTHFGDTEPFYVFVDSNGEVQSACWSGYHWIRAWATADTLPLVNDTHVAAWPVNPWHHYSLDPATTGQANTDVQDLRDAFSDWLSNGWNEDLRPGCVTNPWTMEGASGRRSWWRGGTLGFSATETFWATLQGSGLWSGNAPEIDA